MPEALCRTEGVDGLDLSRHFSYYAFEGQSGTLRWKHEVRTQPALHQRSDQDC